MDERQAKQLHYEVMGIALAIRGHTGESGLFMQIDVALAHQDWAQLAMIQSAFNLLSDESQALILGDMGEPDAVGRSIAMFERTLYRMDAAQNPRSA